MTLHDTESQMAAPDTGLPESRRRWALILLAGALALDTSGVAVINAALPSIGDEYDIDSSTLQWTMTAYSIAFAGFLLFGGRVADVLGRRKIFAVGVALFAAASLGAALAPTVGVLIVARRAARVPRGAVRAVTQTGKPIPQVAEELGVHPGTLHPAGSRGPGARGHRPPIGLHEHSPGPTPQARGPQTPRHVAVRVVYRPRPCECTGSAPLVCQV